MSIIDDLKKASLKKSKFLLQLQRIKESGKQTNHIEETVLKSASNLKNNKRSFIIYGEPQSGKTEMMICLAAKLLDENFKIIIILVNDNVHLKNQNLRRFSDSRISPTPKDFSAVIHPDVSIGSSQWLIFCKKNSSNLKDLLRKIDNFKGKIIIDDESDFASPNSKINQSGEKTAINKLVGDLIDSGGSYIGVTATPARLDLNNTFDNQTDNWVDFKPHDFYNGFHTFFPPKLDGKLPYYLNLLPDDEKDDKTFISDALFRFIVKVSYLNTVVNKEDINYSMLIHTGGETFHHDMDYEVIQKTFNILNNEEDKNSEKYWLRLKTTAEKLYPDHINEIMSYAWDNRGMNRIVVMNSKDKSNTDYSLATQPASPFTIAIGGNIVSRGVTFDNLLSMFFTRATKTIQQDTYIQRARMFGTRGKYIQYFELHIPRTLYDNWARCFLFHFMSLESIRSGVDVPSWVGDDANKIKPVASSSIDKVNVDTKKGEISYEIFDYDSSIEAIENQISLKQYDKLIKISEKLGEKYLPSFLLDLMKYSMPHGDDSIAFHTSSDISNLKSGTDQSNISRPRSFMGKWTLEREKFPNAIHHFKILYNAERKARVFYKYDGKLSYLRNTKNLKDDK